MLLLHDGELRDVASLLASLEIPCCERRGRVPSEDLGAATWELLIATPERALECGASLRAARAPCLVVMASETRTLLAMLRRSGVDLIVRRPVHPAALQLLLLHTLYRGPEKRRRERVSVGAPVHFRTGLLRRSALLADLSLRGCRLLSQHAAKRDATIRVQLPIEITGNRALQLKGRVVRTGPASGEDAGTQAIAVHFEQLAPKALRALQEVVDRFAQGPAVLRPGEYGHSARRGSDEESPPVDSAPSERRSAERRGYEHSVIALGNAATRVLIGRDISVGGMRVEAHESLQVGEVLRIALHQGGRAEPLVVEARVARDDGQSGALLRFHSLDTADRDYLTKLVNDLPSLASLESGGDGDARAIVISEIVEDSSRA